MAKANLVEMRKRDKYISEQKHPAAPLLIWNYTPACQFASAWDKYTMEARGLITDLEGNIIARPFKKFFNYGDEKNMPIIPVNNPVIYPKFDGSLGILYWDNGLPCIATRGSFTSDQAVWATGWIQTKQWEDRMVFDFKKTYLFEIIYPENRIVVDYKGLEGLILLAVIETENGYEHSYGVETEGERLGIPYTKHLEYTDLAAEIEKAKKFDGNQEGYVLHWPLSDNLRMKIKGNEYVRLHRLLTQFSSISVWELLKEKQAFDEVLAKVPDEFYDWVKETQRKLEKEFSDIFESAKAAFVEVGVLPSRKDQALAITKKYQPIASYVFAMLDSKDPSPIIWRNIRPKYEKPFLKDIDA